jgi:hypothetical protein
VVPASCVVDLSGQDDSALDLFLEVEARVLVGRRFGGRIGLNRPGHDVLLPLMSYMEEMSEETLTNVSG